MSSWTPARCVAASSILGVAGLFVLLPAAWCTARAIAGDLRMARVEAARVGAEKICAAAELHLALDEADGVATCPTLEAMIAARLLEPGQIDDAWARPYRISCVDGGVRVVSDGRDGIAGTADDITSMSASARSSNPI